MLSRLLARLKSPLASPAGPQLASVTELESEEFQSFMKDCNRFATDHGLRTLTNWSKVWEYPWLYHHGMSEINWKGKQLLDFGSEISPMPWWLATRGARVTLIETDRQWLPVWETLRRKLGVDVSWHFVDSDRLPLVDLSVDAVTSFSVIEHQRDKKVAVDEIARVLRPGGPLFISFDICEPELGMTFPAWNGRALTLREFEQEIWRHPAFGNHKPLNWNREDIAAFKSWHLQSAPHHNYVCGAAVLVKSSI